MLAAGMLYERYGDVEAVRRVLGGVAPAAAGLIIATVAKMAAPMFRSFGPAPFVLLATAFAIGLMRWPLLLVLIVLVPVEHRRLAWWMAAMKADGDILVTLAVQFAIMSLLALGGANAVVPEMHRQAVELRGWMSEREFADMFAISQAAPGPNVMLVTLIGYHVAGVAGALVTTLAMCGPTAVLAHFLGRDLGPLQGCALAHGGAGGRCADFGRSRRRQRDRFDPRRRP